MAQPPAAISPDRPAHAQSFAAQLQTAALGILALQLQPFEADAVDGNARPAPIEDANALAVEQVPRGQHAAEQGQGEDEDYQQRQGDTT
ncbi:hypothetical protein D3C81_1779510 [compost metagenome]